MALGAPGQVLVTSTAKDLVPGSGFGFEERETQELKGVPGRWPVFAVTSVDGAGRPTRLSPEAARARRDAIRPPSLTRRRRWIPAVAGLLTAALVVIGAVVLGGNEQSPPPSEGIPLGSAVEIDPETGDVLATVTGIPSATVSATQMDFGEGGLWIAVNPVVVHIDPEEREIDGTVHLGGAHDIAVGVHTAWVAAAGTGIARIAPATNQELAPVSLPDNPLIRSTFGLPSDLAVGEGAVWATFNSGGLIRIDRRGRVTLLEPGGALDKVAAGEGAVWLADQLQGTLSRLEPGSETAEPTADLAGNLDILAAGEGYVWALDSGAGTLTPVDPESGPKTPIRIGEDPTDLAVGFGAAWVSDGNGTLTRIDGGTLERTTLPVDGPLAALALDADRQTIWVLVAER
jgi:streptogramin lyase